MDLTTIILYDRWPYLLFLKSKILSLKGTHNKSSIVRPSLLVVSEVKDTKFERNSQLCSAWNIFVSVVSEVKDTKFERNSQHEVRVGSSVNVVSEVKDTKFERNSQRSPCRFFSKLRCF